MRVKNSVSWEAEIYPRGFSGPYEKQRPEFLTGQQMMLVLLTWFGRNV